MLPTDVGFYLICVIPPGLLLLGLYPWLTRRRVAALGMALSALSLATAFIFQEGLIRMGGVTSALLLSFGLPALFAGVAALLWKYRLRWMSIIPAGLGLFLLGLFAVQGSFSLAAEALAGRLSPHTVVRAYLDAVARGDISEALGLWPHIERLGTEHQKRRQEVTTRLKAASGLSYRFLDTEWWSTCCEPHVVDDPRLAGFARIHVEINGDVYVFDVWATRGGWCWEFSPLHWGWRIVDVYREGEQALYWPYRAPTELDKARATLLLFFSLLRNGWYEQAVQYYGGPYDLLREWNPSIPPDDYAALLERGCKASGLACLRVRRVVSGEEVAPGEFSFVVEFEQEDGSLFELSPCCGAEEGDFPVQTQFTYTVKRFGDRYVVMELPPYVP